MKAIPDIIKEASRNLRKNMTKAEKLLWKELRAKKLNGIKFTRQAPTYVYTENFGLDRYIIPDFLCCEHKLIIELDGSIHSLDEIYLLDKEKEKLLKNAGYRIIRFKNEEVFKDINSVLQKISTLCSGKE